jgi:hypothetical protein
VGGGTHISMDETKGMDPLQSLEQLPHDDPHHRGSTLGGVGRLLLLAQHDSLQAVGELPQLTLSTSKVERKGQNWRKPAWSKNLNLY